ncbi:MAG: ABC transporter ATP-binding protein [Gammaproteobacteria bacterium]
MSLKVVDVTLTLGDGEQQVTALDHVSLNVQAGELLAVVGPSGSGKSSLLAVVGGLRQPTTGQIFIGGDNITALNPPQLATVRRDHIGFVFQQSNLLPALTALDQLLLVAHLRGRRPHAADRRKALELLGEMGMAHRADRRPGQLSGGERQRIGIARALMSDPTVLLADEPTSMLDHGRGRQIIELLAAQCHQRKVAAIMVTHDPDMLDCADRIVHIVDGRLAAEGPGSHAQN